MPQLTWLGGDEARRAARKVPYRILDPVETVGDPNSENLLIQGDNLEALKGLLPFYAGRVKCIFIDPPYNTNSAFEHYDDNLEHSQWLSMMYPRLELLMELLSEDGSIWVTIDDNEVHYLKIIMDEIFGRKNFIGSAAWEKSDSPRMDAIFFSYRHDNILVFAKDIKSVLFRKLPSEAIPAHYNRTDSQGRRYYTKPLRAMGGQGETREARPTLYYMIKAPDGTEVFPKKKDGTDGAWRWKKEKVLSESDRIDWVQGKNGWTPYFRIYADALKDRPAETIWFHQEVGTNRTSKAEINTLRLSEKAFETPKPEGLMRRILQIATKEDDLVLDSFLGSGTTAAVAQKMRRRYIGIEMGTHAASHCLPRLKQVVQGEQGGISEVEGWKGGGGFRFMKLGAKAFLENGTVNPEIRFAALASYVWFLETRHPSDRKRFTQAVLGHHSGVGYALLYNGILGDKRSDGGNVLTNVVWNDLNKALPKDIRDTVIYGEACRLSESRLKQLKITFKQIPYDIGIR
jgi:adenine-specific DNA-methyltransferase